MKWTFSPLLAPFLVGGLALAAPTLPREVVSALPAEQVHQLKLLLEQKVKEISGHPSVSCDDTDILCVRAYDVLLSLDWTKSQLDRRLRLSLTSSAPTGAERAHYILNTRESSSKLQELIGATLESSVGQALEALERVRRLGERPRPQNTCVTCVRELPPPCPQRQDYYDKLFAEDVIDATLVLGYRDEHEQTVWGVLTEYLLKTTKIPVNIKRSDDLSDTMMMRLFLDGYSEQEGAPSSKAEWHMVKPFFYKGVRKELRFHFFAATVPCKDERLEGGIAMRYDDHSCPEQDRATQRAKRAFLDAFNTSRIVLYGGHSRWGRGPDFGPSSRSDGKVSIRSGALDAVALSKYPTIVFLDSCGSQDYFGDAIEKKRKASGDRDSLSLYANTGEEAWDNQPTTVVRLLRMLTEAKCPDEVLNMLNLPKPAASDSRVVGGI